MPKEVKLLECVLDQFLTIKEVLNSTNDIEHCLAELRLDKEVQDTSEVLKKAKNIIDSLYNHSVKIKDDFYKQYSKFQNLPVDEGVYKGNNGPAAEGNASNNIIEATTKNTDAVEEDVEQDGINLENPDSSIVEDNNKSDSLLEKRKSNSSDAVEKNSKNDNVSRGEDCVSEVDVENSVSQVDQSNNNTVETSKNSADKILQNETNDVTKFNSTQKDKETSSNDAHKEKNDSELSEAVDDPLEIGEENSNIVDNDALDNSNSTNDMPNEEFAAEDTEKTSENTAIKQEPRIRLVDLSKLIDPKPRKSVTFDNSVIILTSSDEDSNSSKKKNDRKDQNANQSATLKSAVKTSLDKNHGDAETRTKKEKNYMKDNNRSTKEKSRRDSSDSEESDCSSSDSEIRVVDTLSKKNKTKELKKSDRRKSLSEKNRQSSDSDQEMPSDKKNKSKDDKVSKAKYNSRNDKENSDSGKSDEEPIKKKKKPVKEKDTRAKKYSSDSSDCVIQEVGDKTENRRREAHPENNSRRSSRLTSVQNQKQKRSERLRNVFQHKLSKFSKSKISRDFRDSESDTDNARKQKSSRNSKKLVEHLSDTSSLSDDENEDTDLKEKFKKNKKRKHKEDLPAGVNDKKFTYKVYIPLPQIKCERLKEIYLKNKEILEIKSLRKINLFKSNKRTLESKSDSKSSSDTEKPKQKKSKKNISTEPSTDDEHSSDDGPLTDLVNKDDKSGQKENVVEAAKPVENDDDKMAEIVMDQLDNQNDEGNKSEESNGESEKKRSEDSDSDAEKKNSKEKTGESEKEKKKSTDEKVDETSENEKDKQKKKTSDDEDKKSENETNEETDKDHEKKESDDEKKKAKKKWRSDKLLTVKIDSTDSEEEFSKFCKKKDKSREEIMRKTKKRAKKAVLSDSDDSSKDKNKSSEDSSDESEKSDGKSSSKSESEGGEKEAKKKPVRRRIKKTKGSSSSSSEEDKSTRKQIRRLIGKDSLSETTKQAEAEEKERKARIAEKQKKYNQFYENVEDAKVSSVVLDYDEKEKEELLTVHKSLVKKLKPHQASGVQFMWDACFESVERAKSTKGSGCILAHCMGLGKTLQVIALGHTLLTNSEQTGVQKILVVCPVNTVLNWKSEFKKWLPRKSEVEVYELVSCKQSYERQYIVKEWHSDGGVLIIGYTMFRNLSNPDNKRLSKKVRTIFQEGLVDPGPDLVVCDEGHLLKNEKTNLSIAMNRIKTLRRIVLTGTPLQNNLKEYWCMVQFIKPNLLGTYKEYLNRFVNPITNGQYTDSTQHDIILMRKRSHVLHKLLDGVVQRRDYSVLEPYLPPKHEHVLFVRLTETQVKMYKYYMEKLARQNDGSNRTSFLFNDFQQLQRICTHPRVMLDKTSEKREKEYDEEESEGSLKDFIDDGEASSGSSSSSSSSNSGSDSESGSGSDKKEKKSKPQQRVRVTRAQAAQKRDNNEASDSELEELTKEWWQEYCDGEELDNINNSGKMFLLFQILKECEEIGDKVLVFSQSLYTLNCIEYFLEKIDEATQAGNTEKVGGHTGSWSIGLDYFRLDGSSSCDNRATWCDNFNNPNNTRARLFLISTKAGGLGINLVAANRVIIFDVSWNPSHDIQSIYRVYRFGQTKPCYIYRFVTYGAMEMKIYERQVTKQAISKRVIDEQQIDRHYNQNDLQELYKCDLEPTDRPIPLVPKDVLLGEMLQKYEKTIFQYHLHQSLLENKQDEQLNEEERKAAWEEFENEKVLRKNTTTNFFNNSTMSAQAIATALASIVRKDNPGWSETQVRGIIPALVQQLQVQLAEGDMTMYSRVQQEMQLMQAIQAQKLKEAYFQQQVMRMIQQQQQQAKMLGNLNVDPTQLARSQGSVLSSYLTAPPRFGGPSSVPPRQPSNDVIELND